MKRHTLIPTLTTAAAAALVLAACTGSGGGGGEAGSDGEGGGDITLSYAFFAPAASFPAVQMEEWAAQLNERTDGQVTVETFPGGTLLSAGDIYDGVSQGVVDVGLDSPAYDTERFPFSSVINQPIGIENSQVASATFLDLLLEYEPEEFSDYVIITAFTTEPAYIQSEQAIDSAAAFQGVSLRSAGAAVPTLEAFGANPVGLSMADVAENLQTGVIDGYISSREVMRDFSLAELVDYVTDYPFGVSNSFVAVMDRDAFEALPQDVQDTILELREEMSQFASELHDGENVAGALEFAQDEHGVEILEVPEDEAAEWDTTMESLAGDWVTAHSGADFDAQEVLDRMRELADEHSAELGEG
ncbi:TRAP transporter solute receptor, unknown substrate 3 [Actinomycetales bacterium JB111]|nr:TRAP transporter solute receptor, unknown substrate 3 [Actinomycetales bacterium JB111]